MLVMRGILLLEILLPDVEKTYSGLLEKCIVRLAKDADKKSLELSGRGSIPNCFFQGAQFL